MTLVAASTVRYAATSVGCLCLHNAILISSDHAGWTMMQSATASFCIMVVVGYRLMAGPVFRSASTWLGFWRYTFAMALNFPMSTSLLWLLMKVLGQPMTIAAPTAAAGMAIVNFVVSRWAITGRRKLTSPTA